jgi:alkanesulfonate monooxygenase SsuD/methylene tetrahydromethanopterin reductase-like flavin-dependent oxidoreductase (luciferase family)
MRVGLLNEGSHGSDQTLGERWAEVIREALVAEEVGFDFWGTGEQHFLKGPASFSSPEVVHGFLAGQTERIRFRPMSVNLLPYNHPVRIAEQIASLDVLSNGRAELGGARSNNPWTLEAFGIDPSATRRYRDEALRLIAAAWTQDPFSFEGETWQIAERSLVPRPMQKPHPPISISATGLDSHSDAGRIGIGVMTGNTSAGWEYTQACIDAYRQAAAEAEPITGHLNQTLGIFSTAACCAPTREEAKREAQHVAFEWMALMVKIYTRLSEASPDYAYLANIRKVEDRIHDIDYLIDCSPYVTMGTPSDFIERGHRLFEMGADEWILRVDGMTHEAHLRTLRLLGEEVLPELHRLQRSGRRTPGPSNAKTMQS